MSWFSWWVGWNSATVCGGRYLGSWKCWVWWDLFGVGLDWWVLQDLGLGDEISKISLWFYRAMPILFVYYVNFVNVFLFVKSYSIWSSMGILQLGQLFCVIWLWTNVLHPNILSSSLLWPWWFERQREWMSRDNGVCIGRLNLGRRESKKFSKETLSYEIMKECCCYPEISSSFTLL